MSSLMVKRAFQEKLTPGEKLVFVDLAWRSNDDGECFALLSSLIETTSMSKRAVQDNLTKLEGRKLVTRNVRGGRSSTFKLYPTQADLAPIEPLPHGADLALHGADLALHGADSAIKQADLAPITTNKLPNNYLTIPQTPTATTANRKKPQAAQGEKIPLIDLPVWVTPDLYADIVAHRKSLKCPVTVQAMRVVLELAEPHVAAGQDLRAMLNQSISNGWKGLFPLRAQQHTGQGFSGNDPLASNGRNWIDQVDLSAMGGV
jgi:hypothetical protein